MWASQSHAFRVALEGDKSAPEPENAKSKRTGCYMIGDGKLFVFETLANGTKESPLLAGDPRFDQSQTPTRIEGILGNWTDADSLPLRWARRN